jgi:toxin ParE1/3/4
VTDRLRIHRRALNELRSAVKWYEKRETGVGWKLWNETLDTLDRIGTGRSPGVSATTRWPDRVFKKVFVERFTYTVFFEWRDDRCYVWAIAHGRRKPGYWYGRVERPDFPGGA